MKKTLQCQLCPTECVLENYQIGGCRVRINIEGELYSLVYGKPCAVAIDPIEKKPFFHVLPGTKAFSIATVGCVLGCKFCQNWQISQARPEDSKNYDLPPDNLVRQAVFYGCSSIAYTYTEPTVFYEYMYDTAEIANRFGVINTMHTCGYINERPLRELSKVLQAACVDLKAFTEDFYARLCGGRLKPVLDCLLTLMDEGVWIEITNLVIPTQNDNPDEIRKMCKWIYRNLGPDVPIHFSRFFPYYKMKNLPPTPFRTLQMARQIALEEGMRYVYIGNIRSEAENTYCPNCKRIIIQREGYLMRFVKIKDSRCEYCGFTIKGVWS